MSIFTPGRRWQPPFYPFKKEKFGRRLLAATERWIKGPLFGCRMCGNCLLRETAFICPMECPKGLRNGPCGGSTSGSCYVDETRPCIWYRINEKAFRRGREELLLEVLPPLDWDRVGTETWGSVLGQVRKTGTTNFLRSFFRKDMIERAFAREKLFRPIRQPGWWNGDALYHPPAYEEPVSELERKLKMGEFVVTSEIAPPLGAGTEKLRSDIEKIRGFVTAINFTDNSSASPRMSSMACCKVSHEMGVEPVLQVAARERTRSGLQADIVGANAVGIRNVLCISGDSPRIGPTPFSQMNILDIDSVQMLWILRKMRDEGKYLDGREMKERPKLFLGAAASPFASEPKFQALREHKKINAGAQFFETNIIFDADRLDLWLEQLYKRDILDKVYILAGITPLRSCKMAYYLHNKIPGVSLPDNILKRMEDAGDGAGEEGIQIALGLMEALKQKQGINGIHIMAVGGGEVVPRLVTEAGLSSLT